MIKRRSRKRWSCTGLEFIADSLRVPPLRRGGQGGWSRRNAGLVRGSAVAGPAENTASDEAAGYALFTPPTPPSQGGKGGLARAAIAVIGFALALTVHGCNRLGLSTLAKTFRSPSPNIEGFTVAGKASLAAKPNLVEIDVEVSASSELTADAIVKYRDARRRLQEAFTALKLANVTVEERGLQVDQKGQKQNHYYWGGMPNPRNKTEVQLSRKLVVKASNLRKMDEEALMQLIGKLLDVAQDAGAKVGPQNDYNNYWYYRYNQNHQGLVRFVLDDFDKLQEEAYEKAIADARAPGRTTGAVEPCRARADRGDPGNRGPRRPDIRILTTTNRHASGWKRRNTRISRSKSN